jgi:hypothetical protein
MVNLSKILIGTISGSVSLPDAEGSVLITRFAGYYRDYSCCWRKASLALMKRSGLTIS